MRWISDELEYSFRAGSYFTSRTDNPIIDVLSRHLGTTPSVGSLVVNNWIVPMHCQSCPQSVVGGRRCRSASNVARKRGPEAPLPDNLAWPASRFSGTFTPGP